MVSIGTIVVGVLIAAAILAFVRWMFSPTVVVNGTPVGSVYSPNPYRSAVLPAYYHGLSPSQRVQFYYGGQPYYYQNGYYYNSLGVLVLEAAILGVLTYELANLASDDVLVTSGVDVPVGSGSISDPGNGAYEAVSDMPAEVAKFDNDVQEQPEVSRFADNSGTDQSVSRFSDAAPEPAVARFSEPADTDRSSNRFEAPAPSYSAARFSEPAPERQVASFDRDDDRDDSSSSSGFSDSDDS